MARQYEVFGRRKQDEALTRIGTVSVEEADAVEAKVQEQHGEDWLELVAIPCDSFTWAIGKE